MKKTTILITALIMLFVGAPQAKAVPMYYTFEGNVSSSFDVPGFISDQFGPVPTMVTYTVIIDFDAPGTQTYNDTSVNTYIDSAGTDYYYTDAYSGDYLMSTDGGSNNADGDVAENNYGRDYLTGSGTGTLYVNSQDSYTRIYSSSNFSTLAEGASGLSGYDYAYNTGGVFSYIGSSLTLTSILPVSVPEPSTLLLLGSGLLALGMFWRVRQEGLIFPRFCGHIVKLPHSRSPSDLSSPGSSEASSDYKILRSI